MQIVDEELLKKLQKGFVDGDTIQVYFDGRWVDVDVYDNIKKAMKCHYQIRQIPRFETLEDDIEISENELF